MGASTTTTSAEAHTPRTYPLRKRGIDALSASPSSLIHGLSLASPVGGGHARAPSGEKWNECCGTRHECGT